MKSIAALIGAYLFQTFGMGYVSQPYQAGLMELTTIVEIVSVAVLVPTALWKGGKWLHGRHLAKQSAKAERAASPDLDARLAAIEKRLQEIYAPASPASEQAAAPAQHASVLTPEEQKLAEVMEEREALEKAYKEANSTLDQKLVDARKAAMASRKAVSKPSQ